MDDFTGEEKHVLMTSAWLHDIGLIGLDRGLVHRFFHHPQDITANDRALIREHPIYGQALAAFVDRLSTVGVTIRAHHERYDGTGYPDGLAGAGIPWTARCLAVAVAFAQHASTRGTALQSILEESGKAFDPEAVRVFLKTTQRTELPRQVREIAVSELQPGMLIARGIYVPSGMLLIAEGQQLTAAEIAKLHSAEFTQGRGTQVLVYR